jgi:hypothetical protein
MAGRFCFRLPGTLGVSGYARKRKRLGRVFRISGCPGRGSVPGLDALPEDRLAGRTGAITPADEAASSGSTASGSAVKDATAFTPLRCGYQGLVQPLTVAGIRSSTGSSSAGVGLMARPGRRRRVGWVRPGSWVRAWRTIRAGESGSSASHGMPEWVTTAQWCGSQGMALECCTPGTSTIHWFHEPKACMECANPDAQAGPGFRAHPRGHRVSVARRPGCLGRPVGVCQPRVLPGGRADRCHPCWCGSPGV